MSIPPTIVSNYFRLNLLSLFLMLFLITSISVFAADKSHSILIISSYNPDAHPTSANISDFMDEYHKLGGTRNVIIENLNCKSFSEFASWKVKMKSLLQKYTGKMKPEAMILLGQEAWASYLSQKDSLINDVPVICCMVSKNAILLPDKPISLQKWMPESVDFFSDSLKHQVKAGFMYEYDVPGNINLIKRIYPNTRNIAFISDNSYGGVSLQAHVIKEMKKFPDLKLILLDGRSHTIYTIVEELRKLPPNTAILLGTWKVDMNEGYFVHNAAYVMMDANPKTPAFSLTVTGFGYWALGGIMPNYHIFGRDLARQIIKIQKNPRSKTLHVEVVKNKLLLDYEVVQKRGIDLSVLGEMKYDFVNKPTPFYEQYKYFLLGITAFLIFLILALFISLLFYFRTKKLKDNLEISERELRIAKDKAEESNRLKTAFLANMSHEIRTPLNAIVGFSEVLVSGGNTEEEQRNYIDIVKTNSDMLLRLINDILDVSKLESDRVQFEYEKNDVILLCRQILTSLDFAKKSNNKFLFSSSHETFELKTDVNRLQQILFNLLFNANKYTDSGVIKLEFIAYESFVEFSVTDSGCGIPQDKHQQVFERFTKLNEYSQGAGLGLSICQLIVAKWGGDIWVDTSYHDGARIVFTHPIKN
ncbi:sensor histidine kinase [Bacteroides ihuae]|uniref:sensor histidine kinase n=1 Tax=Bacteroides ihuae TaxID=1852362 RepID=UPI0008DAA7BB|nr:HAMP domain-containing sensor histidine kinase [Bacteroides ihuae]